MPFLEYYRQNVGEVHILNGENLVEDVEKNVNKILLEHGLSVAD